MMKNIIEEIPEHEQMATKCYDALVAYTKLNEPSNIAFNPRLSEFRHYEKINAEYGRLFLKGDALPIVNVDPAHTFSVVGDDININFSSAKEFVKELLFNGCNTYIADLSRDIDINIMLILIELKEQIKTISLLPYIGFESTADNALAKNFNQIMDFTNYAIYLFYHSSSCAGKVSEKVKRQASNWLISAKNQDGDLIANISHQKI